MKWMFEIFKMESKKILSYRIDFWFQFGVVVCTEVGMAYYLWKTIFEESGVQIIGGMTFEQMLIYYCLAPFIVRFVKSNDDFGISREIYEGGINKYLVYPMSFMFTKMIERASFSFMAIIQMCIGLFVISYFVPVFKYLTLTGFIATLLCIFLSFILYFLMSYCLELVAFWFEFVWSLGVMLRFLAMFLGGAMIPLEMFPDSIVQILHWTPFPYLFSFPIQIFLGKLELNKILFGIGVGIFWIVPLFLVSRKIQSQGLRNYTGVGL